MRFHCSLFQALKVTVVNAALVTGYVLLLLNNDQQLLQTALFVALIAVALQTPLLCAVTGTASRLLVLFLAMSSFLFVMGLIIAWDSPVGASPGGTYLARLDGGFRMLLLGQVFAMPGFLLIAPINLRLLKATRRHD